ncbi:hypothetical protein [Amycolatopsis sp. lyj-84]|uniref:hypothetical protein n=1 Tax=Amycolatopsis sp. lyj-84 TaxID=2789284 RepID=UPI00397B727B
MAELREYRVTVNGHPTVMNLTEEDATRLGGVLLDPDPSPEPEAEPGAKQRADPPNKARAIRNKDGE